MPSSNLWVAGHLVQMAARTGAKTALDVGPGHGKFGVLLREYSGLKRVDAVEAWAPYVGDFRLNGIYDEVTVADVRSYTEAEFAPYDLVFISEMIEHVPKEDGLDLLARIPGWVVLSTPLEWFQEDHEVPTEIHRSLWNSHDFRDPRLIDRVSEYLEVDGGIFVTLKPKAMVNG